MVPLITKDNRVQQGLKLEEWQLYEEGKKRVSKVHGGEGSETINKIALQGKNHCPSVLIK